MNATIEQLPQLGSPLTKTLSATCKGHSGTMALIPSGGATLGRVLMLAFTQMTSLTFGCGPANAFEIVACEGDQLTVKIKDSVQPVQIPQKEFSPGASTNFDSKLRKGGQPDPDTVRRLNPVPQPTERQPSFLFRL